MIVVYYDEDMNVNVNEYTIVDHVPNLVRSEVYQNPNSNAKLFKDKIGVVDSYIIDIIVKEQSRFKGQRVIIFDSSEDSSYYDDKRLIDLLFIYRREITVIKADMSVDNINILIKLLGKYLV